MAWAQKNRHLGHCEWAQAHPWVWIKHGSSPAEDISENLMIFPRRASCPLMQGATKYLCRHSQAFLSTVARCTVLFKSYGEMPHDTVPWYSAPSVLECTCSHAVSSTTFCFSPEKTCHHSILLVCTWHILSDLLCHQSGTHLPVTLICQSLLAQWMWTWSRYVSADISDCSPTWIHTWQLTLSNHLLCKFPLCECLHRARCLSLPQPMISLPTPNYFSISS